jgi:hypothetical protein
MERMIDHTLDVSSPPPARTAARGCRGRPAGFALCIVAIVVAVAARPVRVTADDGNALPIEVEVEGDLAAPLAAVRDVLLDFERFPRWFPATAGFRVLERPTPDTARVYGTQALPWPVGDRDYVVVYRWWEDEGVFVLRAIAEAGVDPPPPKGVVRVERMQTEWRIAAVPGGTAVRYRYAGDTGGRLPGWIAQFGWRSSTGLVIDGLREEVARRAAVLGAE